MPHFGTDSKRHLATCDPQLQDLLNRAIVFTDFSVTCGFRDQREQDAAYAEKTSTKQWPFSKHNVMPSRAVDIAPYPIDWEDTGRFHFLAGVILWIAYTRRIPVVWGGHWKNFPDLGHFELR